MKYEIYRRRLYPKDYCHSKWELIFKTDDLDIYYDYKKRWIKTHAGSLWEFKYKLIER